MSACVRLARQPTARPGFPPCQPMGVRAAPQQQFVAPPPRMDDIPDWTPPAFYGNLPCPESPSSAGSRTPRDMGEVEEPAIQANNNQEDAWEQYFPAGCNVEYFSTTYNRWVDAVVMGHNKDTIALDCQASANPKLVRRPVEKLRSDPPSLGSTQDDPSVVERVHVLERENRGLAAENDELKRRCQELEAMLNQRVR
mmetsp:Transcript_40078/g.87479  ORF Transcript_40078/g.87479 Transcript_40078/m.87479 type:complete len:197 (+) Transcript_40078:51-641(+)